MPDLTLVEKLYPHNYRDIPAMLRRLADDVEHGDFGELDRVAVVIESEDGSPSVRSSGNCELLETLGLLHLGIHHLCAMRNE